MLFKVWRNVLKYVSPLWIDPRGQIYWNMALQNQFRWLLETYKPDIVISSSPSDQIHSLPLRFAQSTSVRKWFWVADYRDPFIVDKRWAQDAPLSKLTGMRRRYARAVYNTADLNVAAIPVHYRYIRRYFPSVRSAFLPNGVSGELLATERRGQSKFDLRKQISADQNIIFSAGFLGLHELAVVQSAVSHLNDSGAKYTIAYAASEKVCQHMERVVFVGYLSKIDVYIAMQQADVLLCALSPERASHKRLSSKLIEYLSVPKYILLINPSNADAAFVRDIPHVFILRSPSGDDVCRVLQQCIYTPDATRRIKHWAAVFREEYSRENQVEELFSFILRCKICGCD